MGIAVSTLMVMVQS